MITQMSGAASLAPVAPLANHRRPRRRAQQVAPSDHSLDVGQFQLTQLGQADFVCSNEQQFEQFHATTTAHLIAATTQTSKRKEKARIAARIRRSQEANIITDMADELTISQDRMRRIDKTTIIKLAIDYIKAFDVLCRPQTGPKSQREPEEHGRQQVKQQGQQQYHHHNKILRLTISPPLVTKAPLTATNESSSGGLMIINQGSEDEQQQQLPPPPPSTPTPTRATSLATHPLIRPIKPSPTCKSRGEQPIKLANLDCGIGETSCGLSSDESSVSEPTDDSSSSSWSPPPSQPFISTASIFEPKTIDNTNSHYLMIEKNEKNGQPTSSFVLKPDDEILDEDDLTHLAPQAGDMSIPLNVDPLETIVVDDKMINSLLVPSPAIMDAYCQDFSSALSPSLIRSPISQANYTALNSYNTNNKTTTEQLIAHGASSNYRYFDDRILIGFQDNRHDIY